MWPETASPDQSSRSTVCRCWDKMSRLACPRRGAGWKSTSISAHRRVTDNTHRLGGNCRARTKCPNRRTAQRTQIPRTSVESRPRHMRDKMFRISPLCRGALLARRGWDKMHECATRHWADWKSAPRYHLPLQPTGVKLGSSTQRRQGRCGRLAVRSRERFWNGRVRRVYGTSVPRFAAHTDAQKDCV